MMYCYKKSEPHLWTVGHYDPINIEWVPESDHGTCDEAANRVAYLNGEQKALIVEGQVEQLKKELNLSFEDIEKRLQALENNA